MIIIVITSYLPRVPCYINSFVPLANVLNVDLYRKHFRVYWIIYISIEWNGKVNKEERVSQRPFGNYLYGNLFIFFRIYINTNGDMGRFNSIHSQVVSRDVELYTKLDDNLKEGDLAFV